MKENRLFAKTHEWAAFSDETTARLGISDFAQSELGDLVFINLPEVGDEVTMGESFADVESVKEDLLDQPELVNNAAYEAWFVEVEEISEKDDLLTEEEYKSQLSEEE